MSSPPLPSAESSADDPGRESRVLLSALADGDPAAVQPGMGLWRDDAQARRTWHTYQLIGDVLRSDDLAQDPAHDQIFMARLRTRLASEPVVLAPVAVPTPSTEAGSRRRHAWLAPAAVAAGFMAVAGVLVVSRLSAPAPADGGPLVAASPMESSGVTRVGAQASSPQTLVIEGRLIRDAQLDSYLRAHRAALGGVAVAVPGGTPRNVETLPAGAR